MSPAQVFQTSEFEPIFQHSPNPYVVMLPDLTIVDANEAYLRMTGRRREDLVGRGMFDAFPGGPDHSEDESERQLRASFERVLKTRATDTLALIRYPIRHLTADGEVLEVRYWSATNTPLLDDDGDVKLILQHTIDVTELQQLKEAARLKRKPTELPSAMLENSVFRRAQIVQDANRSLEAEAEHLRRLFDQTPGFVCFLRGPDHVFEIVNQAYYQLVGHRKLVGLPVRKALPELEQQGYVDLLNEVYRTGKPFAGRNMSLIVQRQPGMDKEEIFADFIYQPIIEANGTVGGIFVQGHDITEKQRAEQELCRYRDHLEELVEARTHELEQSQAALWQAQKLEAVGQLTGGVAHDFNNLLQVISGNLELLSSRLEPDSDNRRFLQAARNAVERGARLSSQLLAFARRQTLQPQVFTLHRLLNDMSDLLRRAVGEAVEVELDCEKGLWNLFVDPYQLENVILNLAINARDAMSGSGRLRLAARNISLAAEHAAQLELAAGDYLEITLSDTGAGISPELIERVFEPFYTTKPAGRGTGLGLSMAYGFIKQSGGHLLLESTVGEGTTVRLYLPRTDKSEQPRPSHSPKLSTLPSGSETVLVVEDNPAVRGTVVQLLSELGYQVLQASDAEQALEMLEHKPVDLLFTDVVMPGTMFGHELAKQAISQRPGLAILLASGYSHGLTDPPTGISLLRKPYGRDQLAVKVREALDNARPHDHTRLSILLVEDDEELRNSTQDLLEDLGHVVHTAEHADAARRALERNRFDLLFTDYRLPGATGLALAREALQQQPELRVLCVSGYDPKHLNDADDAPEGTLFLTKPYELTKLESTLKTICAARLTPG